MTKHYDGIIIGAGITGCSIAYFLAKKGYGNLLVIDKGGIASDITGICPGGVRQQWGTEINCKMSKFSVDFFENINDHLEPEQIGRAHGLNSSHVAISYAVFCLKKKKKHITL